jgi:hypothetical protein
MSNATRKRTAHARRQPYAWLGVGAVTLGMGAAMVGGTAVAFADTGSDSGNTSNSASGKPGNDSSAKTAAPRRGAHSAARGANADNNTASAAASTPVNRGRTSAAVGGTHSIPVVTEPDVTLAVENNKPLPAAVVTPQRSRPVVSTPVSADPAPAASTPDVSTPSPATDPTPAAAAAPAAADPAPGVDSWLPVTPIVPGAHVALATDQITQAQALIKQETWGSGNVLAGLGSFGPLAALATAQALLGVWSSTIAGAQLQVANTVGQPLIHNIAQARLQNELTYTKLAGISLQTASALIKPLGWFGADVTQAQDLVSAAQQNGKVYAKVPVTMVAGTEPVVKVKINGGATKAKLLVDTGASGIVTTQDKIGSAPLGQKTGEGNSCFSGGLCYHYDTYNTTVDLGDGASAIAPVNIVTNTAEYPDSVTNFKSFFAWGADGILGVGANSAGPGPTPIPTAAMPGELSDGVLIYEKANLFGGGYMILGPNLFPTRVSVSGAPDAYVKVSINGGAKQDGGAIIDSGGVYGTLNRYFVPGATGDNVPAGTKIDVYTPDGATLLYSYTTQGGNAATPYIDDSGLFNTGNAPYAQGPIYINYGTVPYTGVGSTDFSIY